ncbi:MAG: asparaginase [Nitriliruptorales bacterium]|nr:asparaginase [Nitriliruptorales bacterium]
MSERSAPPELVRVIRDGRVESVHRGHVVVTTADGALLGAAGDPEHATYARSAVKPFQTLAVTGLLAEHELSLDALALAIASASHLGTAEHQIEAARLLALAGVDEAVLRCPSHLPADLPTLLEQRTPTRLANNCSGKHAGFVLAQAIAGEDPADYLDVDSIVQQRVRKELTAVTDRRPLGPGVDGCGAPAWVVPLAGLALGFARLARGEGRLGAIAQAMRAHPDLVGGTGCDDTALMRADRRVVAKRGAEGVLAAGFRAPHGERLGMAVKIADGAGRAAGPVVAEILGALGARVPVEVRHKEVLGGGAPRGFLDVDASLVAGLGLAA